MRIIELHPASALEALAAEEAVLEAVNAGASEPAWISWTAPSRSAVLGTSRLAAGDLFLERLRADNVPVLRRRSGGGTVLLGPESPVATMIARLDKPGSGSIRKSYADFCEVLIAVLSRLNIQAHFEPPADLAAGGRKIAGLAQRRKRSAVLVGASVLAEPLAAEAARWLREPAPADSPAYRAGRAHGAFMASLAEFGRQRDDWPAALRAELAARGASPADLTTAERARTPEIQAELAASEWIERF